MLKYNLDYFGAGVVVGACLIIVLFFIFYLSGLIATKSDFSSKWLTKAKIKIISLTTGRTLNEVNENEICRN